MELELKDLLFLLWQKIYWTITCAVIGGAVAFLVSYFMVTPIYSATATLYVDNSDENRNTNTINQGDIVVSQHLVEIYKIVIESDTALEKVISKTDYDYTAKEVRDMLSVSAVDETEAFTITIDNEDPAVAQELVNTIVDVIPDEIPRILHSSEVKTIDRAKLPAEPSSPNIPINTAVGIILGFLLCAAIIIIRSLFDTTIHTEEDLAGFEIPVIGIIPALDVEPMGK